MNNLNTSKKRALNAGTASLQRQTISSTAGTYSKIHNPVQHANSNRKIIRKTDGSLYLPESHTFKTPSNSQNPSFISGSNQGGSLNQTCKKLTAQNQQMLAKKVSEKVDSKASIISELGRLNKTSTQNPNRGIQSKRVSQKISPRLQPSSSQESIHDGRGKHHAKNVINSTSNMIETKLEQKLLKIQKSLATLNQKQYRESNQMKILLRDFSTRILRCQDQQRAYLQSSSSKIQKNSTKQTNTNSLNFAKLEKRVKQLQDFRKSLLCQTSFNQKMEKFKIQNGNITPIKHSSIKSPRVTIFGDITPRGRKNEVPVQNTPKHKKKSPQQNLTITVSPNQMDKTVQFHYSPNSQSNKKTLVHSPKKNSISRNPVPSLNGFSKKMTKVTQINLINPQCLKSETSSGKGVSSRSSSRNNILNKFTSNSRSNNNSSSAIQANFLQSQQVRNKNQGAVTIVSEKLHMKQQLIKSPQPKQDRQYYSAQPTTNKFLVSKKPIQPSLDEKTNQVTPFMTTLLTSEHDSSNVCSHGNIVSLTKQPISSSSSSCPKKVENKLISFKQKKSTKKSNKKDSQQSHPVFSNMADKKNFRFEQPPMSPIPFQENLACGSQSPNEFLELESPYEIQNNMVVLETSSSGLDPIIGIGGYGMQSDKMNQFYSVKNKKIIIDFKQSDNQLEQRQIKQGGVGFDQNDENDDDERQDSPLPADQLDSNYVIDQKRNEGNKTTLQVRNFRSNNSSVNSVPESGPASQNISQKHNSFKLINSLNSNNCPLDSKQLNFGESYRKMKFHLRNPSVRRKDKNSVNSMIMVPQIDLQYDDQIHRGNESFTIPHSRMLSPGSGISQNVPQHNLQFTATEIGHIEKPGNEKSNSPHFLIMQQQEDKDFSSNFNTNKHKVSGNQLPFEIKDISQNQKYKLELNNFISTQDMQSDYNFHQTNQSGDYITQKKRIPSVIKMPIQAPSVMRAPSEQTTFIQNSVNRQKKKRDDNKNRQSKLQQQKKFYSGIQSESDDDDDDTCIKNNNPSKLSTIQQKQQLTPTMPFQKSHSNHHDLFPTPSYEDPIQSAHRTTINATNLQRPRKMNQDNCSQNLCEFDDDQCQQQQQLKIKGIKFIDRGQSSLSPNKRRNSKPAAATAAGMRMNNQRKNALFSNNNTHSASTLLQSNTLGKMGGGGGTGYISHTVSNIFSPKNNNVAAVPIDQQCTCKPALSQQQDQYLEYESSIQFKSEYSNNYVASIRNNKNVKDSFEVRRETPHLQEDIKMINEAFPEPCGQFCKNLPPHIQKQFIYETLMEQIGEPVNKSTAGKASSKKFLISAEWWRKWKDYVEFDFQTENQANLQNTGGSSELSKNRTISMMMSDEEKAQDKLNMTSSHQEFIYKLKNQNDKVYLETLKSQKQQQNIMRQYDYPGPITNADILQPGSSFYLRSQLLEHYDFEALNPSIWRYLNSWYGSDFNVTRFLVKDKMNPSKLILEMYPSDPSAMAGRNEEVKPSLSDFTRNNACSSGSNSKQKGQVKYSRNSESVNRSKAMMMKKK